MSGGATDAAGFKTRVVATRNQRSSTGSLTVRKDGARVRLYSHPGVRSYPITPA